MGPRELLTGTFVKEDDFRFLFRKKILPCLVENKPYALWT